MTSVPVDLEGMLSLISSEGWLVRTLGQSLDGSWRASLHRFEPDGAYITPDCYAPTIEAVLAQALTIAHATPFTPYRQPLPEPVIKLKIDLTALGLGLMPDPTFTLTKRFAR